MTPSAMLLIRRIYYLCIANKDSKEQKPVEEHEWHSLWSALPPKVLRSSRFLIHVHPVSPWGRDIGSLQYVVCMGGVDLSSSWIASSRPNAGCLLEFLPTPVAKVP